MAQPSTKADAVSNPHTRCSNCQTVFEVTRELLASSDTRVRCGECLCIFDALEGLRSADRDTLKGERESLAPVTGLSSASRRDDHDAEPDTDLDADAESGLETAHDSDTGPDTGAAASIAEHAQPAGDRAEPTVQGRQVQSGAGQKPRSVEAASLAGLANDTAALDVTYSDFDLFSEDAELPDVAYFDQTRDTPEFDFDAVEISDDDETFSDTLFAHDVTINADATQVRLAGAGAGSTTPLTTPGAVSHAAGGSAARVGTQQGDVDFVGDEGPREPLVFVYRDPEDQPAADPLTGDRDETPQTASEREARAGDDNAIRVADDPPSRWLLKLSLGLLIALLVGALFAFREQDRLFQNPTSRPAMVFVCRVIGCDVPARVDLTALQLLRKDIGFDAQRADALQVSIAFTNQADFAQPFPTLNVRLTSRTGQTVARRRVTPADYLDGWHQGDLMSPGKRVDVSLVFSDPGAGTDSFDLEFLPSVDSDR